MCVHVGYVSRCTERSQVGMDNFFLYFFSFPPGESRLTSRTLHDILGKQKSPVAEFLSTNEAFIVYHSLARPGLKHGVDCEPVWPSGKAISW